ncbi:hypothetical protein AWM75_03440 [Aerococcus urinaehominis]|uniref:Probable succinyl-diaminopimelate desuccinylase n=1 Tax=Aerococcus urinaehominis TaxID=128944 RepID=A0A0X8FM10_9LACT|nr:M20 family metallopeptidase [Aerococcus urinaehominis]AMB99112.1 hypothetical protein AWM75_03440 [Aerococcus urinaehominis]SDM04078.1 succinyl-diaminopimelate desuccinylase [Aerococcus urinaehominis]
MTNEQALTLLQDMLQVDSRGQNEAQVIDIIQPLLEDYDFTCQRVNYGPGRDQLLAVYDSGQAGPIFGIEGHTDVVPVGDEDWQFPPFAGQVHDGKIYGRGACDMKGGLAAAIAAVIRLRQSGYPKQGKIQFIITADEETGLKGAGQLVKAGLVPEIDVLVCAEPTNMQLAIAHKGVNSLSIESIGVSAHSARAHQGINANHKLLDYLEAARKAYHPEDYHDEQLGPSSMQINVLSGGKQINVVPDFAEAIIDMRTVPSQDHDVMLKIFTDLADQIMAADDQANIKVKRLLDLYPLATPADHIFVQAFKEVVDQVRNQDSELTAMDGSTDCAEFMKVLDKTAVVIFGPGDSAHQTDEFISLTDYYQCIEIFEQVYLNWIQKLTN